jgi:hypothetical protein
MTRRRDRSTRSEIDARLDPWSSCSCSWLGCPSRSASPPSSRGDGDLTPAAPSLIAGIVAAATSLGIFVVTLGVIDRMHTWDVSMGDHWNAAFVALLSVRPLMIIVGTAAYRRLRDRRGRVVLASGSGLR